MIERLIFLIIDLLFILLIVNVILSWLVVAGVRNDIVRQFYAASNQLLDPIMRPLRRYIPPVGMVDITPLVAFIILIVVREILQRVLL